MPYQVKDKVVFITGAATGIGAEVVKALVAQEPKYVVVYDINEKQGIALQNELNSKYGEKVKFIKGDVTDENHFVGSLKALKEEKGLDVLINNAGIMNDSWESYKKEISINVTSLVTGTLHAIELMRKDKGGSGGAVFNISSIAGLSQGSMLPIYFGTKSAVLQFSNCIGHDDYFLRTGVRVVAICFGRTDTPLLQGVKHFEPHIEPTISDTLELFPNQTPESAAKGVVEVIKNGESGTTWLVIANRPARDISSNIRKAYEIMSEGLD